MNAYRFICSGNDEENENENVKRTTRRKYQFVICGIPFRKCCFWTSKHPHMAHITQMSMGSCRDTAVYWTCNDMVSYMEISITNEQWTEASVRNENKFVDVVAMAKRLEKGLTTGMCVFLFRFTYVYILRRPNRIQFTRNLHLDGNNVIPVPDSRAATVGLSNIPTTCVMFMIQTEKCA